MSVEMRGIFETEEVGVCSGVGFEDVVVWIMGYGECGYCYYFSGFLLGFRVGLGILGCYLACFNYC